MPVSSVGDIYHSKLGEIQARLDAVSSRTGIKAPVFYSYYQEAIAAGDTAANSSATNATGEASAVSEAEAWSGILASTSTDHSTYDGIVQYASAVSGLEANMIKAVIQAESSFRNNAVSSSGAEGLMQLKPGTAASLGVTNSFDPAQNILAGSVYLSRQLERFGDIKLALAAYNTGPSAISNMAGVEGGTYDYNLLTQEEKRYVDKVMQYYTTFNTM